eukprot:gene16801-biopygen5066
MSQLWPGPGPTNCCPQGNVDVAPNMLLGQTPLDEDKKRREEEERRPSLLSLDVPVLASQVPAALGFCTSANAGIGGWPERAGCASRTGRTPGAKERQALGVMGRRQGWGCWRSRRDCAKSRAGGAKRRGGTMSPKGVCLSRGSGGAASRGPPATKKLACNHEPREDPPGTQRSCGHDEIPKPQVTLELRRDPSRSKSCSSAPRRNTRTDAFPFGIWRERRQWFSAPQPATPGGAGCGIGRYLNAAQERGPASPQFKTKQPNSERLRVAVARPSVVLAYLALERFLFDIFEARL